MYSLDKIPLFKELEESSNVLIAGAGGGFDIYSGIPIFLNLLHHKKNVYLASYSFTNFEDTDAKKEFRKCRIINHTTRVLPGGANYSPEKFLAEWLTASEGIKTDIYCFYHTGVVPLKEAYIHIVEKHDIDTVIVVDGGTDSLMFGDEEFLGTPEQDISSILAVSQLACPKKYLVCTAFGVDKFHKVSHYRFLENVSSLINRGGFVGAFSLLKGILETDKYIEAVRYANKMMPKRKSIVANSVVSAIEGSFGNQHNTERTRGSELFINPLMAIYWCFELCKVAEQLTYPEQLKNSETFDEVTSAIIAHYLGRTSIRPSKNLPL
jgi:hypothetical protein